jgi:chromate transporter
VRSHGVNVYWGCALLALWVIVLIVTVVLGSTLPNPPPPLLWWQVFYRTGSIIYGGGQVVLPMLYNDVVQQTCDAATGVCTDKPNTWVTSKQFYAGGPRVAGGRTAWAVGASDVRVRRAPPSLCVRRAPAPDSRLPCLPRHARCHTHARARGRAGLGVVQAMPGPLFNFAAYLGAIIAMNAGYSFAVGAVLAWFGLFAPGVLIIFGAWRRVVVGAVVHAARWTALVQAGRRPPLPPLTPVPRRPNPARHGTCRTPQA